MNSFLLNRQLGSVSQQAFASAQNSRLLRALQSADNVVFAGGDSAADSQRGGRAASRADAKAHGAGVNSLTTDRFEGR